MKTDLSRRLSKLEVGTVRLLVQDMRGKTKEAADAEVAAWIKADQYDERRDLLVRLRRFAS